MNSSILCLYKMTRMFVFVTSTFLAGYASAQDVIILNDGRTISCTIIKEDADTVFIKQDGEDRGVARTRIAKIERNVKTPATSAIPPVQPVQPAQPAKITPLAKPEVDAPEKPIDLSQPNVLPPPLQPGEGIKPTELDAKTPADLVDIVRHLGLPALEDRKTAQKEIIASLEKFTPIMMGMLHPKFDADIFTRLGILRLLAANAPLSEQGSRMVAYVALHDPFAEVRREACIIIRNLSDDEAVRSLMKHAGTKDPTLLRSLAVALREIDDNRLLAALVRAVPQPTVSANMGEPKGLDKPKMMNVGGLKIPVYLPEQEITGTATDIESPAADLLKLIAQKNLGNLPNSWRNWLREKAGDISQADRESYKDNRSILNRMGSPPSGNKSP